MKIYGIKNCDTVKKALKWLDVNGISYEFHDYKKQGITPDKLKHWARSLGWESLLNKKGTTWKKLDPALQSSVQNEAAAVKLMQESTSIIKRPLIENDKHLILGFSEAEYQKLLH
jgi:Spx/MgsR family transcriptional regulator